MVVRKDMIICSVLVGAIGLEPTTPTMSRWCSNQLSYAPKELRILWVFEPSGKHFLRLFSRSVLNPCSLIPYPNFPCEVKPLLIRTYDDARRAMHEPGIRIGTGRQLCIALQTRFAPEITDDETGVASDQEQREGRHVEVQERLGMDRRLAAFQPAA